jgi:hypothetical protein
MTLPSVLASIGMRQRGAQARAWYLGPWIKAFLRGMKETEIYRESRGAPVTYDRGPVSLLFCLLSYIILDYACIFSLSLAIFNAQYIFCTPYFLYLFHVISSLDPSFILSYIIIFIMLFFIIRKA